MLSASSATKYQRTKVGVDWYGIEFLGVNRNFFIKHPVFKSEGHNIKLRACELNINI